MCHVSHQFVGKISLQIVRSDNYDRPSKRKFIDKHGNVSWMETAKINEPDESDEDQSELDFDIAKLCRVSNQFVGKISLGIVPSYKGCRVTSENPK